VDKDVRAFAGRVTANYKTENLDGVYENIAIQNGDFQTFPLAYLEGQAPVADDEIALSLLSARDYEKSVGDTIEVIVDSSPRQLTVVGIYQDLTNGGRSAQAHLPWQSTDVLWYAVSVDFIDGTDIAAKVDEYSELFAPAKVVDIYGYISQTLESTIQQFTTVTLAVTVAAITVAVLITALFMRLMLARDRGQITIMKGLGFTSEHIRTQYLSAIISCLAIGLLLGTLAANTLGEGLIGLLMSSLGASRIDFVIDPLSSFLVCPALLLVPVLVTIVTAARPIQEYATYDRT
jgi:putative ABC transport system permease protein